MIVSHIPVAAPAPQVEVATTCPRRGSRDCFPGDLAEPHLTEMRDYQAQYAVEVLDLEFDRPLDEIGYVFFQVPAGPGEVSRSQAKAMLLMPADARLLSWWPDGMTRAILDDEF